MPCRVLRGALPKAMPVSLVTRNPDGGGTRTIATQGGKKGRVGLCFLEAAIDADWIGAFAIGAIYI